MPPTICLVGATGAVGRECLAILESRRFSHAQIRLLASARSAGAAIPYRGKSVPVEELGPRSFDGADLAFFAAGADTAKAFAPIAIKAGTTVIDKSSAHRADPNCPLVIPEINPETLAPLRHSASPRRAGVIAVPNCSTIILMVPLEPLRNAFGIERIVVSTYQAASGAGAAAMAELEEQTRDVLAGKPAEPRIFKEPCAFNVFSHDSAMNPTTGENGEESKMAAETRRIWNDPSIKVVATCVRVPVMRGHSESINVTLKKPASESEVREALAAGKGLTLADDRAGNRFPTPLKASGGDTVLVGRLRPDPTQEHTGGGPAARYRGFSLFVSGDQLRMGAALTAVKIAELLTA
jgi:aspartate-semialdehyde dehydrogenase